MRRIAHAPESNYRGCRQLKLCGVTLRERFQYRGIAMMIHRKSPIRLRPLGGCLRTRVQPANALAALVSVVLTIETNGAAQGFERAPNEYGPADSAIAHDVEAADLCGKISPHAVSRAPFNSSGTRVVAERSRCYFHVALRTLNPHHCANNRQVGPHRLGGYYSSANCRQLIAEGKRFSAHFSLNHKLVLKAVGYTDADVTARFPRHPQEDS